MNDQVRSELHGHGKADTPRQFRSFVGRPRYSTWCHRQGQSRQDLSSFLRREPTTAALFECLTTGVAGELGIDVIELQKHSNWLGTPLGVISHLAQDTGRRLRKGVRRNTFFS